MRKKFWKCQLVELTNDTTGAKFLLRLWTTKREIDLQECWQFQWLWYKLWLKWTSRYLMWYPYNFKEKYKYITTKKYDLFFIEIFKKVD